jgi:LacI family transcriptional regulator
MVENKRQIQRQKPLTSVDVARRAGVSRTAVSFVLNGSQSSHVSEETRAKVLQAASELGYHPNTSAQALRKGQSSEICVLSSTAMSTNDAEIFVAMQQHALRLGYIPVFYFVGGLSEEKRRELLVRILARRPLALLLAPDCINEGDITLARQMGIEYILLGTAEPIEEHKLSMSSRERTWTALSLPTRIFGRLAAQHLLERGHRSLGIVSPQESRHHLAFLQRLQGMRDAISAAGLSEAEVEIEILPLHLTLSSAHDLVSTHLGASRRPTGIYTFNDEYALPLLRALGDFGLRVPQDIALVGTDNVAFSAFVTPALTTISFDNSAVGQRVIEKLAALQKGNPPEPSPPLDVRLIVREST